MLLSVIIPVFNAVPYLQACVQSVLRSVSGDHSAEMLLVDDGSTDGSGSLCDKLAASHPGIRVIHKENGGVGSARNAGLRHARGTYIAWVDPDDLVELDWFPGIREVILRHSPDLLVMDTLRFDETTQTPEVYGRPEGFVDRELFLSDLYRDIRIQSGLPSKVIKSCFFEGVHFDEKLPILEDFAAMPGIIRDIRSIYYIPKCLYHYRQHPESLLHQVTPDRAFLSFRIAVKRASEAAPPFQNAAAAAAGIQALRFCQNLHLFPGFHPTRHQIQACIRYVRQQLPALCSDPALPIKWKLKFTLLALGVFRPIRKHKSRQER